MKKVELPYIEMYWPKPENRELSWAITCWLMGHKTVKCNQERTILYFYDKELATIFRLKFGL